MGWDTAGGIQRYRVTHDRQQICTRPHEASSSAAPAFTRLCTTSQPPVHSRPTCLPLLFLVGSRPPVPTRLCIDGTQLPLLPLPFQPTCVPLSFLPDPPSMLSLPRLRSDGNEGEVGDVSTCTCSPLVPAPAPATPVGEGAGPGRGPGAGPCRLLGDARAVTEGEGVRRPKGVARPRESSHLEAPTRMGALNSWGVGATERR